MVITRSRLGMYADSALRKVVLPELVPPLINRLYPDSTTCRRKSAASSVTAPNPSSFSMVMGSGNLRMVTAAPSRAMGGNTTFTREPSSRRASTIGEATLTVRFTRLTICWIMSSSCSSPSNLRFHNSMRPFRSTNTRPAPFTMTSDTSRSSISSCKMSNLRKLSNRLVRSHRRSLRGR